MRPSSWLPKSQHHQRRRATHPHHAASSLARQLKLRIGWRIVVPWVVLMCAGLSPAVQTQDPTGVSRPDQRDVSRGRTHAPLSCPGTYPPPLESVLSNQKQASLTWGHRGQSSHPDHAMSTAVGSGQRMDHEQASGRAGCPRPVSAASVIDKRISTTSSPNL
ncbi:hypothetical protein B0H66DRAFT_220857 [Apodospora peruviana]|uniref:Uncharacterized protein n=1 Tax=Apodospora peruviana TaxID=516989 RepID=A0AAE0I3P1_9PEZI|nr:hypothetical protein B0H66DRAFT_220857 [Apodospora peruviana]